MNRHYEKLINEIRKTGSMAVAFSGGVDSTLLLKAAKDALNNNLIAVTIEAPMHHNRELAEAKLIAEQLGVRQVLIKIDWPELQMLASNPENRCYLCKRLILKRCLDIAAENHIAAVADGSNADDLKAHRPGRAALQELGIVSPLQANGWTKEMIRSASRELGLTTAEKPAQSCLLTRFPHNTEINEAMLKQVEWCEDMISSLGFALVRVRKLSDHANVELAPDQLARAFENPGPILDICIKAGFNHAEIDPGGYKSGSTG